MDDEEVASVANKRRCISPPSKQPPLYSTLSDPSPYHPPPELTNVDYLLHNLLQLPISDSSSSSVSVDVSFEKLLNSKSSDSEQNLLINRALLFGSAIVDAANRHARKVASKHNSHVWVLPHDLTIRVFAMLDTSTLCCAAATCTLFCRCAMDPMCYVDIDLRTCVPKVNNAVLSTMIRRAGKGLESLKVGIVNHTSRSSSTPRPLNHSIENSIDRSVSKWYEKKIRQGTVSATLTRSCFNCLTADGAAAGSILRKLHLYHIEQMDREALCHALSACRSLLDFEVVGLHVELRQILELVSFNCQVLERLFVESLTAGRHNRLKSHTCVDFVKNCPHLTSLALRGHRLHDSKAHLLTQGFHKLKHVDFSMCYALTGSFLSMHRNPGDSEIEVLLLRDCTDLKEAEVRRLVMSLVRREFKFLNQIDVSNREGLVSFADPAERCSSSSLVAYKDWLSKERPYLRFVAEFPSEESFLRSNMIDSDVDIAVDIDASSPLSDYFSHSSYTNSSESDDFDSGSDGSGDIHQDLDSGVSMASMDDSDF